MVINVKGGLANRHRVKVNYTSRHASFLSGYWLFLSLVNLYFLRFGIWKHMRLPLPFFCSAIDVFITYIFISHTRLYFIGPLRHVKTAYTDQLNRSGHLRGS